MEISLTPAKLGHYWRQNTLSVPDNVEHLCSYGHDAFAEQQQDISPAAIEKIWRQVQKLYATGYHPGISLCIRRHGRIVLNRAIGYAQTNGPQQGVGEDEEAILMRPDTAACLFSSSKAITAACMHVLLERGQIRLEDRVCEYIPEFAQGGKGEIRILDVLSHQAGIPSFPDDVTVADAKDWDLLVSRLCAMPAVSPGKTAYHAITGGFILGEIVKRVTGQDIQHLLNEHTRQPMGMTHFQYGIDPEVESARNYATGPALPGPIAAMAEQALGLPFEEACVASNQPEFMQNLIPAGNIYATAEEASRYFQMLLDGGVYNGQRLYKEETVRQLVQPVGGMRFDRMLKAPMRYSAGFMLGHPVASIYGARTGMAFGHLGFINIFCWADPQRAMSVGLITTGKALIGPHLAPLVAVLSSINKHCSPLPTHAWPAWSRELPRGLKTVI